MDETQTDGGLNGRVMRNIHFNARRLAHQKPIRGMDAADYAQDLACDLLGRRKSFNPDRAAFATFADRVVRHHAATLLTPTRRKGAERRFVSLNAPAVSSDGDSAELIALLPDEAPPVDQTVAMAIDVGRFLYGLPPSLITCCSVLLADTISVGAAEAGIHRSTAYDRIERLRRDAEAFGLGVYFGGSPDTSRSRSVCGDSGVETKTLSMTIHLRPGRTSLLVDEQDLRAWLARANAGDVLEYHHGVLAIDRLVHGSRLPDPDRRQLNRVASLLMTLAEAGHGYLLQRRHADGDYSYLFVNRPPLFSDKASLRAVLEDRS